MRKYCHVLATRIVGEPPAFRGKPRFCEKDTVKRRKEITMRANNSSLQTYYPHGFTTTTRCSLGCKDTHISENELCSVMPPPRKFSRPFVTNCNEHLTLRIITGGYTSITYVHSIHHLNTYTRTKRTKKPVCRKMQNLMSCQEQGDWGKRERTTYRQSDTYVVIDESGGQEPAISEQPSEKNSKY